MKISKERKTQTHFFFLLFLLPQSHHITEEKKEGKEGEGSYSVQFTLDLV